MWSQRRSVDHLHLPGRRVNFAVLLRLAQIVVGSSDDEWSTSVTVRREASHPCHCVVKMKALKVAWKTRIRGTVFYSILVSLLLHKIDTLLKILKHWISLIFICKLKIYISLRYWILVQYSLADLLIQFFFYFVVGWVFFFFSLYVWICKINPT